MIKISKRHQYLLDINVGVFIYSDNFALLILKR